MESAKNGRWMIPFMEFGMIMVNAYLSNIKEIEEQWSKSLKLTTLTENILKIKSYRNHWQVSTEI